MSTKTKVLPRLLRYLEGELEAIKSAGTYKTERVIASAQMAKILLSNGSSAINFCANNYLGLAGNYYVGDKAIDHIKKRGNGLSSVRFICGTQDIHKELEQEISSFHNREDAILYISCFDANAGVFPTLFTGEDVIITDELNHASIIDGIRHSKAAKAIYKHRDMNDLEEKLKQYQNNSRFMLIVTDGVFSMDGSVAPLKKICDLAEQYDALTFVDDCHATGFFGKTGRGTEEYCDVMGRIDIINSTLGKALGGAAGGYTTASKPIIDILRQRSRPYLFSNTLPPAMVGGALAALEIVKGDNKYLGILQENTKLFRGSMKNAGFTVIGDDHPICPVMMPDEKTAVHFADSLLSKGIYVIGFTYPVVPKGKARIRVQMSASHAKEDVERCIDAFIQVGKELGTI